MADKVRIEITATDNASDDFQKVGAAAAKMGTQVTQAGKAATQGLKPVEGNAKQAQTAMAQMGQQAGRTATDMGKLGTAAKKAGDDIKTGATGVEQFEKAATKVGAGLGTLVTGLAAVGTAFVDQERQVAAIQRAYGEAGDEILAFTEDIQDSTTFSNDAARQSALAAQSLAANYGLTAAQIQEVVTISADLASVYGIELVDATQRVAGAIRGEGEAAELLGLNLSDSAVAAAAAAAGLDGWTTSMTESEKAAFRMTLVSKQSAFATGAAGDAAETSAGQAKQLKNEIQDLAASFGDLAGPAAEVASVLGPFAMLAPVAGAGIGKLVGAVAGTAAASSLGAFAVSIAGVGAAAAAAAVPLGVLITTLYIRGEERAESVSEDVDAVTASLARFGLESDESAKKFYDWIRTSNQVGGMAAGQVQALNDSFDELLQLGHPYIDTLLFVASGMDQGTESAMILGQMIEDLYQTQLQGQTALYGQGLALEYATSEQQAYTQSVEEAAEAEQRRLDRFPGTGRRALPGVGPIDPSEGGGLPDYNAEVARSVALQADMAQVQVLVAERFAAIKEQTAATAAALSAANQELIAFVANGENIIDVLLEAGKTMSGNQGFLQGVKTLIEAKGDLDSTFDVIIGGTQDLAASGQQVADWASGLTGITFEGGVFASEVGKVEAAFAAGEISAEEYAVAIVEAQSQIDGALSSGKISQDEYNAATTAATDILWNNALIQEDIAVIQAKQAPLMASRTNAYQDQIAALAELDAEEQRHALLMMDSGIQTEVATAYSTAYAASLGEIPPEVASELILAEAASNPDLGALLEELGLIERDHEGNLVVNFPDGPTLTGTLETLNSTLADLITLIDELNGKEISPNISPEKMQALMAIGTYTPATPGVGEGTGGSQGTSFGPIGGNAAEGPAPKDVKVTVTADAEPYFRVMQDVTEIAALTADTDTELLVTADNTQALTIFRNTEGAIVAVANGDYIVKVMGDPSDASNDIALVNDLLNQLNGTEGVVYILGDASNARSEITSVTGYQGEAYIYIRGIPIGTATSTGQFAGAVMRDGGVVGYDEAALNGTITRAGARRILVGEGGPEIVHLPPGSGVTPASLSNAIRGNRGGGREMHFHFHAPVYGVDDLQAMIGQAVRSTAYQGAF